MSPNKLYNMDSLLDKLPSHHEAGAFPVVLAAVLADQCRPSFSLNLEISVRKSHWAGRVGRALRCTSWAFRQQKYPSLLQTFQTETLCPSMLYSATLHPQSMSYAHHYVAPNIDED